MKSLLRASAVLLLICPAVLAQENAETVTFSAAKDMVGRTVQKTSNRQSAIDFKYLDAATKKQLMQQKQMEVEGKDHSITTLAVSDAGKATKIEVAVKKDEKTQSNGAGQKQTLPSPLAGKTLVLELKDGKVVVSLKAADKAKALSKEEVAMAKDLFGGKLKATKKSHTDLIPDRAIKVGETLSAKGDEGLKYVNEDERATTKSFEIEYTLTGVKEYEGIKCGVFKVSLKAQMAPEKGALIGVTLTGESLISIDGKVEVMTDVKGPMTVDGTVTGRNNQKITISGKGTMTLKDTLMVSKK